MNTLIPVDFSDATKLRILVEEYITMQRREFIFRGVCDFVLYRAMEEDCTAKRSMRATSCSLPTKTASAVS